MFRNGTASSFTLLKARVCLYCLSWGKLGFLGMPRDIYVEGWSWEVQSQNPPPRKTSSKPNLRVVGLHEYTTILQGCFSCRLLFVYIFKCVLLLLLYLSFLQEWMLEFRWWYRRMFGHFYIPRFHRGMGTRMPDPTMTGIVSVFTLITIDF